VDVQHDSMTVQRDIAYADRAAGPLLLDLHLPAVAAAPVVIWLHGGGWFTGDRTLAPDLGRYFADRGIAMASIDYRLSSVATFPAQLVDVQAAIRYLRGHCDRYGVDGRRIGLWGSSAGGHLAALAGLTGRGDTSVSAVAESYGPTDLTDAAATMPNGATSPEAALLGDHPDRRPAQARAASPLHQVTEHVPPFQISHGTADTVVPQHHSERLHSALVAAGVDSELFLLDGYRHGFLNPGGRIEGELAGLMDDGRLLREGRAVATRRGRGSDDQRTTFGFDDIGDFFARHLGSAS
jgi:acetyl esterase/lipase